MDDNNKTKEQLVAELAQMQKRITILEKSESECKKIEDECVKNEKLYKEIQALAHIGYWKYEPHNDSLFWSDELYSIFEVDKDGGPLVLEAFLKRIHPSDRDIMKEQIGKGESYRSDYRIVMDDGSVKYICEEVEIEYKEDGKIAWMKGTAQDITERKQAKEELKRQKERSDLYFNTAEVIMLVIDKNKEVILVNDKGCKVLGYEREEILGKNWFNNFLPERLREEVTAVSEKLFRGEIEPVECFENPILTRSGEERIIAWHNTVLRNEKGEIISHLGCGEDITARKQTEKLLSDGEAMLKSIFRAAPTGIGFVSNRVILQVNDRFCEMVGYSSEELVGKNSRILYPSDEDYEYVGEEKYKQILEKGTGTVETHFRCKDGRVIDILLSSTPIDLKNLSLGATFTALDITHRKKAEKSLRQNETLLLQTEELAHVGSWELDLIANRLTWSDEVYRIFGLELGELDATYDTFLGAVHPEDSAKVDQTYSTSLSKGEDGYEIEHRIIRKNTGEIRYVHEKCIHFRDTKGTIIRSIGMIQDITERKRAEEALAHSHDLMRYIIEHSRGAVAVHDRELNYVYVSQSYLQDYKVKECDVIGKHHYDVFPDLPQKWRDVHQRALAGEVLSAEDDPYVREDGTVDWTRWECRPWYEADGSIGGIIIYTEIITERKKVEAALIESEESYKNLVESQTQFIHRYLPDTTELFVNQSFVDYFGMNKNEIIGFKWIDLALEEDREYILSSLEEITSDNPTSYYENQTIDTKGEKRWVGWINHGFFDENGNATHFQSVGQDITERKKAEKDLLQSEGMFRSLFDGSAASIIIHDSENGEIIDGNQKAIEAYGVKSLDELKGNSFWSEPPYSLEDALRWIHKASSEGPQQFEWLNHKIDGTPFWENVLLKSIPIKGVDRIMAIALDITDNKLSEDQIKASEQRLSVLFENSPDAIYVNDLEGNFMDGNTAAEKLIGYKREDLIGKNFAKLNLLSESQLPKALSNLKENAQGKSTGPDEFILDRKDGSHVEVEIRTHPVCIGGRNLVMGVARDIGERKKTAEALRLERDNLGKILDTMEDGVYIVDEQYNLQYVNPSLKGDFGSHEGQKCYAYLHDSDEVCPWCKNNDVFAGNTVQWEWYSSKNQKTYDLIDTPLRNADGSLSKLEIFRDITERKKSEEELKRNLQDLQQFKDITVDRENKMIELKREVNKLCVELGRVSVYNLSFLGGE